MTELETKIFSEIESKKTMVIDFKSSWCFPCKMITPFIEELKKDYEGRVIVEAVDVDENDDITTKFGIRNLPTVVFIKDGEVVDRISGAMLKSVYVEKTEALLA